MVEWILREQLFKQRGLLESSPEWKPAPGTREEKAAGIQRLPLEQGHACAEGGEMSVNNLSPMHL